MEKKVYIDKITGKTLESTSPTATFYGSLSKQEQKELIKSFFSYDDLLNIIHEEKPFYMFQLIKPIIMKNFIEEKEVK